MSVRNKGARARGREKNVASKAWGPRRLHYLDRWKKMIGRLRDVYANMPINPNGRPAVESPPIVPPTWRGERREARERVAETKQSVCFALEPQRRLGNALHPSGTLAGPKLLHKKPHAQTSRTIWCIRSSGRTYSIGDDLQWCGLDAALEVFRQIRY